MTKEDERLSILFEEKMGYKLNPENPVTFNEKILWLKTFYTNPLVTDCTDKLKARDYIRSKVGSKNLVDLIGVYKNSSQIDFDKLPNSFIAKVNWGCSKHSIVKDKSSIDKKALSELFDWWVKPSSNHYHILHEWGYKDIEPKISIEKYLGDVLDYKIYCAYGKPKFFYIGEMINGVLHITYYDMYHNRLPLKSSRPLLPERKVKPSFFDEMVAQASKLSEPFPMVRIDFLVTKTNFYNGELTFYSGGGYNQFEPKEWDKLLGNLFILPIESRLC